MSTDFLYLPDRSFIKKQAVQGVLFHKPTSGRETFLIMILLAEKSHGLTYSTEDQALQALLYIQKQLEEE